MKCIYIFKKTKLKENKEKKTFFLNFIFMFLIYDMNSECSNLSRTNFALLRAMYCFAIRFHVLKVIYVFMIVQKL